MHRHVEHKHSTRKPPRKKKEPRDRRDTIPVAPRKMEGDETPHDEKKLEGEGSYTAGRRYDEDATKFAKSGDVDNSARKAADDFSDDDELLDGVPSREEEIDDADTLPGYRH
jgi:hypothetical protein